MGGELDGGCGVVECGWWGSRGASRVVRDGVGALAVVWVADAVAAVCVVGSGLGRGGWLVLIVIGLNMWWALQGGGSGMGLGISRL